MKYSGNVTKEEFSDHILYFFGNGTVKWMDLHTLLHYKNEEELAYVRFLLLNRAEVTQKWRNQMRIWIEYIEQHINDLYKIRSGSVPPFKLMCCGSNGKDRELGFHSFEILKDKFGPYMEYQGMDGDMHTVDLHNINKFKFRPDQLKSLHYQIICSNLEMIELKEKVGQALAKSEEILLKEFLKTSPEFRRIPKEDEQG